MPAYFDDVKESWYVQFYYTVNDVKKHKVTRGFDSKLDALEWERAFKAKVERRSDMTLNEFFECYQKDVMPRIRLNTWKTKESIIVKKILPYLGEIRLDELTARDINDWQNKMLMERNRWGDEMSATYLRTINNQLSAMLNHAVKYYNLPKSPAISMDKIGSKKGGDMHFWTKEQYLRFSREVMDKPHAYHGFEMLYWCGIRIGELLALTPADFDFVHGEVSITKSYQRIDGNDIITPPKTEKSNRVVTMPDFLTEEMQDYIRTLRIDEDERIFNTSKDFFRHEMKRGCKAARLDPIRIHDLRHSHVSLLIEMGFSALAIADRVGHESVDITYRYAHLFPNKQAEMANALNDSKKRKL